MNEFDFERLEGRAPRETVAAGGAEIRRGDRVVLRPRAGGDAFDAFLAGRTAVVESIEEDYEGKIHVAVVVDDDPGRDLGLLRQSAHRFFFAPDELAPAGRGDD